MVAGEERDAVLVVDDEVAVCTFFTRVIERSGLSVVQAHAVREGRALVGQRRFLAAFIDKNLPDGSGIDLMAALRVAQPGVPVVMITAFLDAASAVAAMRAGATDVLSKPFEFRTIRERLEGLLARARLEAERLRLDALLSHADRLATLGTLAAGVAHELNSPLAAALSNFEYLSSELVRLRPQLEGRAAERVDRCIDAAAEGREATQRMRTIAGDLRVYARRELGPPSLVDLSGVVTHAVALAQHATRGRVTVEVDLGAAPRVSGWPTRFEQVVVNLLVNAAQAIPLEQKDGRVRVSLSEASDGWAVLRVSDNGPGVPEEMRSRLFKPFFTTKPAGQGTGLGLSVVADIVRAAGGRVEFEPGMAGGAVFRVVLPPAPLEPPEVDAPESAGG
ncbi:MAG: ATP-binding protein [Myxococcota bacterium]